MSPAKPELDRDMQRELVAKALATPWGYARVKLGKKLHPKQEAVLKDLYRPGSRVVARCGNEIGKTSSLAVSAILHHCEILKGLVVSTAGVRRQVEHQLWPNLTGYAGKYPGWTFKGLSIKDPQGRERYLGFTAADDGTFQGFHDLDGPLMIIVDEAAAVKSSIILSAEERCNPTRFLLMGSPLDPQGAFYDATSTLSKFYKQHKISQLDCTTDKGYWLDPAVIRRKIEKYGPEHPLILSNVFAEFSLKVEGALLSVREWEDCAENPPQQRGHDRHVFLDFAAGGDENVIAVRVGNKVWIEKAWREKNTTAAIGDFLARLNKLKKEIGLRPHEVEGDADGMGIVFCQAIHDGGWPIQFFRGNAEPLINPEYRNRIAEVWTEGTIGIRKGNWILPRDEELKAQMITRKSGLDLQGLLTVESKDKMKARGIPSPDRADAILGAMAPLPMAESVSTLTLGNADWANNWNEQPADEVGHNQTELPGASC